MAWPQLRLIAEESSEPGVERSSSALARWFSHHPGLVTTDPEPTSVGGLDGMVVDISLRPDSAKTCPYAHAGEALVPLIIGDGPAGLHHLINASFTTRLYLLDLGSSNVVIEVVDHPGDDLALRDYEGIIRGFGISLVADHDDETEDYRAAGIDLDRLLVTRSRVGRRVRRVLAPEVFEHVLED